MINSLSQLVACCHGRLLGESALFTGICTDSRNLRPGELFVALRGDQFDGHDFAARAQQLGAVGLLVDHPIPEITLPQLIVANTTDAIGQIGVAYRELFKGIVIGVTGSGGKTTVKGMLWQILQHQNSTIASFGNFNNHIGVPLTLFKLAQQKYAVIEMGTSHPGEIDYLSSIVKPDIALVNNIMPAHIGGFGSLAAIAQEKAAIYTRLRANQWAIINADDDFAEQFITQTAHCRQLLFSDNITDPEFSGLAAEQLSIDSTGCYRFQLRYDHESVDVALAVLGKHMVNNALAAASCAFAAGCTLQDISMGLAQFRGEKGRMQALRGLKGSSLVDDSYNANPGSVKAAIDFLVSRSGNRVLVLGDLGELGEEVQNAHIQIGEYAKNKGIEALYTVGEAAALAADSFGESGMSFSDKHALSEALIPCLNDHTTVLIKGSRSAKMEDICERLLAKNGSEQC